MFEIPGSNISSVQISEDVVNGKSQPLYTRSSSANANAGTQEEYDKTGSKNASRAVNN